jgi:hypothetical protein
VEVAPLFVLLASEKASFSTGTAESARGGDGNP